MKKKKIENYSFSKPLVIPKVKINIFCFKFSFFNFLKIKKNSSKEKI